MNTQAPMPTVDPLLEFRLTQAEAHIAKQDELIKKLEDEVRENRAHYENNIKELKDQSEARERNRLLWGISSLGTLVMLMGGVIWHYRAVIFRGGG